jgi:protease-4
MKKRLGILYLSSAALLFATPAAAQRVSLSEGLATPHPTIVDRDDAMSLELNPAGLAHLSGLDFAFVYAAVSDNIGEGTGGMISTDLWDGLGLGYGLQVIGKGAEVDPYRKHTIGLGMGDDLSLGLAYNFFGSDNAAIDRFSSWDVGLQWRLLRWLGLGAQIRDVNTPFYLGSSIAPTYVLGAAVRSLEGRISLEANLRFQSDVMRSQPSFSLAVEPIDGVRIFGTAFADTGEEGTDLALARVLTGLSVDFDHVGASGAGVYGNGNRGILTSARVSSAGARSVLPARQRFYTVTLRGDIPERSFRDIFGRVSGGSFLGLLRQLRAMGNDPGVQGVVFDIQGLKAGYGQLWELRREIGRLKEQGKEVVAYLHTTGQREYYLAAAADKVFMGPSELFSPRGLALTLSYYRGALDKLGVEPQFLRIREYKSSPESFTRTGPTKPTLEAHNAFLDSIWQHLLASIGNDRGIGTEELAKKIDNVPFTPAQAEAAAFIDGVFYHDELEDKLKEHYGAGVSLSGRWRPPHRDYRWGDSPTVVVIYVDGNIVGGEGGANPLLGGVLTGSGTIAKVAAWAEKNAKVRAVVLRVDSPGGSAVASDLMYRALYKLRQKKPLIVSMGDVAASGGYYVAAAGQEIYCDPTTLTGSIGIFTGKFALNGLYEKIGYSTFTNKRGARADLFTLDRPWNAEEERAVQGQIEYLYELFLSQVSEGRGMERDAVDAVGRGRIWSGADALNNGLCDKEGGLLDAVEEAARQGGVDWDDMTIAAYPRGSLLTPIGPILSAEAELTVTVPQASAELEALRRLLAPLRPAIDLGLLYEDGEALALLPFKFE